MAAKHTLPVVNREIPPTEAQLEVIARCMSYNPRTGKVIWIDKVGPRSQARIGREVGYQANTGYRRVAFRLEGERREYAVHRIAWFLHYDEWPAFELDHISRVKNDNRICNLRLSTIPVNNLNVGIKKNNKSGYRGVCWNKKERKWKAKANLDNRGVCLGSYDDLEEASLVVEDFYKKMYGEHYISPYAEQTI